MAAVIGKPRATLFDMGALPGFFDLSGLTAADVVAIAALVPMAGNLALAQFLGRARRLLASPAARRRLNLVPRAMLVAVGALIPFV